MGFFHDLAIIIPVGPRENSWVDLLEDLKNVPQATDIIFAATEPLPHEWIAQLKDFSKNHSVKWIESESGRSVQMNTGAAHTEKEFLWFLHADSRFTGDTLYSLTLAAGDRPDALHYFDLEFLADGPPLMGLNASGVWLRSHLLRMPFGDQGFCISRKIFIELGGFPENAAYGEDHLLVWKARQIGVPILCTNGTLRTSARRYQEKGWAKTTLKTVLLTIKQAVPEGIHMARTQLRSKSLSGDPGDK
jgi:GT2 family glycosyltransferase